MVLHAPAGGRPDPPGGCLRAWGHLAETAAGRKLIRPTKVVETHEEDTRVGVLFWSSGQIGMERKRRNTKAAPGTCGRSENRVTMGTSYEKAGERAWRSTT